MDKRDKKVGLNLDKFDQSLDKIKVEIKENELASGLNRQSVNLKALTKDLVESNLNKFSFIFSPRVYSLNQRKIERIYSKKEIRQLVCDHLIPEYQHEQIINAVTEYIYGVHVSA